MKIGPVMRDFLKGVRQAALRMGIQPGPEMAMILACAYIESKAVEEDRPTHLAATNHNLFGITWNDGDEGKGYYKIVYPGNEFDATIGINERAYRGYQSFEHCIENWKWHRDHSDHFKAIKESVYGQWARRLQEMWQEGNISAGDLVELIYNYILKDEMGG